MKKFLIAIHFILVVYLAAGQPYQPNWNSLSTRKIPGWFHQDKFGIFIHWGVYSVPSWAPVIPNSGYSYAEWYWYRLPEKKKEFLDFHNKNYGPDFAYQQFEQSFKAELFDPAQWADIFKRSGAKYVVITSKHHEGYTLWNNAQADKSWNRKWNAVTGTPKRDLLGDLTNAVRKEGLRMGYYYSLYEWFNPLYLTDKKRYVEEHMWPQFKDLVTRYKPSVIFSDGEWELSDTAWRSPELLAWLFNESPVASEVVVNDRWGNNTRNKYNSTLYATSEYGGGMDASIVWEESQGIGHSYGYNRNEKIDDYKSGRELVLLLSDIVARGGNLLLDIGPTADGRIPVIMQQRLLEIGDWLKGNGDAVYGTEGFRIPAQWSKGAPVKKNEASFMADYRIIRLVEPQKDSSYIECFFTQKGKDLFCIIPSWRPALSLKSIKLKPGTTATVLATGESIRLTPSGTNTILDLSKMNAAKMPASGVIVVKLKNAL